jgi:hypothetical protein
MILAIFALAFASCNSVGEAVPSPSLEGSPAPATDEPPAETPEPTAPATEIPGLAPPSTSETPGVTPPVAAEVELGETEDMGFEYLNKFIFLGDSTTNGLAYYELIPYNQVWTPKNGTLTLFRWAIDRIDYPDSNTELFIWEAAAEKKPEYLLITLGVNGVSSLGEEAFKSNYEDLIESVQTASPDTKIILGTIFPVTASYDTSSGINNDKINAANEWIKEIAATMGVKFLNTASAIKGADGFLPEDGDNGDGMHPNEDTYKKVIEYIRTHGYQ